MDRIVLNLLRYALVLFLGYFLRRMNVGLYVVPGLLVLSSWLRREKQRSAQQAEEKPEELTSPQIPLLESVAKTETEEERRDVLNKVVAELWPFISQYLKTILQDKVQPLICGKSSSLSSFRFTSINFGKNIPRVTAVTCKKLDRKRIILDMDITYHGEAKVDSVLREHSIKVGINGLKLEGTLRVKLEPLLDKFPFFGAVTLYFPHRPVLHINWTGLAELLELPRLNTLSDKNIMDNIAKHLVAPNHITIPLKGGVKVEDLQYKVNRNGLQAEVEGLIAKDFITTTSDPCVLVHGRGRTEKTKVIHRNLNPQWNEVSDLPGQEIQSEVFDHKVEKDDFFSSCHISVEKVMIKKNIETGLPLKDVSSEKLHAKLENLCLVSDPAQLEQVPENPNKSSAKRPSEDRKRPETKPVTQKQTQRKNRFRIILRKIRRLCERHCIVS